MQILFYSEWKFDPFVWREGLLRLLVNLNAVEILLDADWMPRLGSVSVDRPPANGLNLIEILWNLHQVLTQRFSLSKQPKRDPTKLLCSFPLSLCTVLQVRSVPFF